MFTEDVAGVDVSWDEVKHDNFGGNCFLCVVVCQSQLLLFQDGMWDGSALHNRSVVPEQVDGSLDWNSKVVQCDVHGHVLLDSHLCR